MPFLLLLIAAFVAVPILELYLILQVGDLIGAGPTIVLLIADSLLGGWLLRKQGQAVWRRFLETTSAGRMPHREAIDGGFVIVGAVLLVTPGFLTDAVGLAFLVPPTRALMRGYLLRRLRARTAFQEGPIIGVHQSTAGDRPADLESTAVEEHDDDFFNFQGPTLDR